MGGGGGVWRFNLTGQIKKKTYIQFPLLAEILLCLPPGSAGLSLPGFSQRPNGWLPALFFRFFLKITLVKLNLGGGGGVSRFYRFPIFVFSFNINLVKLNLGGVGGGFRGFNPSKIFYNKKTLSLRRLIQRCFESAGNKHMRSTQIGRTVALLGSMCIPSPQALQALLEASPLATPP